MAGKTIQTRGLRFVNQGVLEASNGGILDVWNLEGNLGQVPGILRHVGLHRSVEHLRRTHG